MSLRWGLGLELGSIGSVGISSCFAESLRNLRKAARGLRLFPAICASDSELVLAPMEELPSLVAVPELPRATDVELPRGRVGEAGMIVMGVIGMSVNAALDVCTSVHGFGEGCEVVDGTARLSQMDEPWSIVNSLCFYLVVVVSVMKWWRDYVG